MVTDAGIAITARVATIAERLPEKWFKHVGRVGHAFECEEIPLHEAARENLLMALRDQPELLA